MLYHKKIDLVSLRKKIRRGEILFAGNRKLKIYGVLCCTSGRRMKMENRVFFIDEKEALQKGYRPCGHCMIKAYKNWKQSIC